jgi:hypothetical protein
LIARLTVRRDDVSMMKRSPTLLQQQPVQISPSPKLLVSMMKVSATLLQRTFYPGAALSQLVTMMKVSATLLQRGGAPTRDVA